MLITYISFLLGAFFNDICYRGLPKRALPTDGMPPVMKVYLNLDKCFAFVEFPTMEIADAAMKLDGSNANISIFSMDL